MARRIVLAFGVAIVFVALVHYGIYTFFPAPKWQDYRIENYRERFKQASSEELDFLEREQREKHVLYQGDQERWVARYFYIGLTIGVLAAMIGVLIKSAVLGSGLVVGGLFVLLLSYSQYWLRMPDTPKFVSLGIVFLLLILVGYKKIGRKKAKKARAR